MTRRRWPRLVGCWRWVRAVIDACAGDDYEHLPNYDELRARAVRGIDHEGAAAPLIKR